MTQILLNVVPSLAGIVLAFCYIPQIITTVRTKDVSGIDIRFWLILDIALLLLTINAVTIFIVYSTWGYMLTEAFNLGLALVVTGLVLKYRKKKGE